MAFTPIDGRTRTGDDGDNMTLPSPSGTVALPAPAIVALYPSYHTQRVTLPYMSTTHSHHAKHSNFSQL